MAESMSSRSNSTRCVIAATIIVIVGIFGFAYVGQQMSHGSSKVTVAVEALRITPLPINAVASTKSAR